MTERLYHEILCPTLTKSGACNCQPVIVADPEPADPGGASVSPQPQNQEEDARVAPLKAGADGQDLSRRGQPAAVTAAERTYQEQVIPMIQRVVEQLPDPRLAPERWWEVYDWCREIQKLAQHVSERVDEFANLIPDPPKKAAGASVSVVPHPQPQCQECGCHIGDGNYCFRHAPYMVYPLKDGSFYSDRNGRKHIWLEVPPSVESEELAADRTRLCTALHAQIEKLDNGIHAHLWCGAGHCQQAAEIMKSVRSGLEALLASEPARRQEKDQT